MPLFRGSSSIVRIITGGCGPAGPRGQTGDTGDGIAGSKGPVGFSGAGVITAAGFTSAGIGFTLNDGRFIFVKGFTGNALGDVDGVTFTISSTGSRTFFKDVIESENTDQGQTARFRNIKVSGRGINLSSVGDTLIKLEGSTGFTSSMGATGQLIYLNSGNTAQLGTDGLTYDETNNVLSLKNKFIKEHSPRIVTAGDSQDPVDYQTNYKIIQDTLPGLITQGSTGYNRSDFASAGMTGRSYPYTESRQIFGFNQLSPFIDLGKAGTLVSNKVGFSPTLYSKDYGGVTFSEPIGSCCFCSQVDLPTGDQTTTCIDYVPKSYCDFLYGDFDGISSCAIRKEGPSCKEKLPCCVGTKCVETSIEKCAQFGGFPATGYETCEELNYDGGCPNTCPGEDGACCLYGVCYTVNADQCRFLGGVFHDGRSCNSNDDNYYNCCTDLFPGACCVGRVCFDDQTPAECQPGRVVDENYDPETDGTNPHYFQGPNTRCANRSTTRDGVEYQGVFYPDPDTGIIDEGTPSSTIRYCCRDPEALDPSLNCQVNNISPDTIAVGSEYKGGVFLGVIGDPDYGFNTGSTQIGSLLRTTAFTPKSAAVGLADIGCDHLPLVIEQRGDNDAEMNHRVGHLSELGYLARDYSTSAEYENYFDASDGLRFNELADIFYGQGYSIHRRWGIIVDKQDLVIEHPPVGDDPPVIQSDFKWGLENRVGRVNGQYLSREEYSNWATTVSDGYLNTSLYQRLDQEDRFNLWFTENSVGGDAFAVDRWLDEVNGSQWDVIGGDVNGVDEAATEGFRDVFVAAFNQMWDGHNLQTNNYSAMGGVYHKNNNSLDLSRGVDGWYLPSLLELGYVSRYRSILNDVDGAIALSGSYWSSTTGHRIAKNVTDYVNDTYLNEPWALSEDANLRYRASSGYYAFGVNTGSGTGSQTEARRTSTKKVRLIKRIPIYVVSKVCYNSESYPEGFTVTCLESGPCSCTDQETFND